MRVDGGRGDTGEPAAQMPTAGAARSLAALFLAAKIADHLGIKLDEGELQGAVEVRIELSATEPMPTNFDKIANDAIEAVAEARRRRTAGENTIDQEDPA